jgi:hypothetical protein
MFAEVVELLRPATLHRVLEEVDDEIQVVDNDLTLFG